MAKAASHGRHHQQSAQPSTSNTMDEEESQPSERIQFSAHVKQKHGDFEIYEDYQGVGGVKADSLRKVPRRRTIYIPSEDTSILTIHPGSMRNAPKPVAQSTIPELSVGTQEKAPPDAIDSGTNRTRRCSLAVAPRRPPLQPALKTLQESRSDQDRPGSGSGKENLALQTATVLEAWKVSGTRKPEAEPWCVRAESRRAATRALVSPTPKAPPKCRKKTRASVPWLRDRKPLKILPQSTKRVSNRQVKTRLDSIPLESFRKGKARACNQRSVITPPLRLGVPLVLQESYKMKSTYPLLREDICRTEIYEEAWRSDQESALAQLINVLFEAADTKEPSLEVSHEERRRIMLRLYQEPSTELLYKRLQASIQFGALSSPKDSNKEISRLKQDVGFRRNFINIWMKTYDLFKLRAAAEVVIGRETPACPNRTTAQPSNHTPTEMLQKSLEDFIDIYLLRNDDIPPRESRSPEDQNFGSSAWCWRRTILRSLMMVFLLDKSKRLRLVHGNIFLQTSDLKSTQAVLKEVSRLLLPSAGDIGRSLALLGFHGSHIQFPLDEFSYRVESLPIAFRDGIRFVRLVELLLYHPKTPVVQDEDVSITLPTGETLSTFESDKQSWVLSQHLKFPCVGRSQKVYNVQLALSALQRVQGIEQIMENVAAEDFVDGHREKTLETLWGLVAKWGLGTLIDCAELKKEIRRLERLGGRMDNHICSSEEDEGKIGERLIKHTHLLDMWARNIAQLHGLTVSNLTTSFADGKVFKAIVDEYERFLPQFYPTKPSSVNESSCLDTKLKRIGCSTCFGKPIIIDSKGLTLNKPLQYRPLAVSRMGGFRTATLL